MHLLVTLLLILYGSPAQSSITDLTQRGQAALQQHRFEDAIQAFDEALSLAPSNNPSLLAGLHYYKAAALGASGDLLVAIANAKRAIQYAPSENAYRELLQRLEEDASKVVISAAQISRALSTARSFAAEASVDLWVNYDFNQDSLSAKGREQADALATVMNSSSFSEAVFVLIGHTDSQGADEYNLDLSRRRALRLSEYLVSRFKIPAGRIRTEGRGERELKMPGNTERDHAVNRRVEVRLAP